jgi:hypothetical protein
MSSQVFFFVSIAFSLIAWSVVAAQYIWPALRSRPTAEALRPLLTLHSFRFMGLAFLVPGVVSPDLPPAFTHSAAFGDIVAATLALASLALLQRGPGIVLAWVFNIWGTIDLLNAFYQANNAGLLAGQLSAAYFIPTLVVPLLLVTHGLAYRTLVRGNESGALSGVLPMARRGMPGSLCTTFSPLRKPLGEQMTGLSLTGHVKPHHVRY